jgi:hypothetical protein
MEKHGGKSSIHSLLRKIVGALVGWALPTLRFLMWFLYAKIVILHELKLLQTPSNKRNG